MDEIFTRPDFPDTACSRNVQLDACIGADGLFTFYHNLALSISQIVECQFHLVDDTTGPRVCYACFLPEKIRKICKALTKLDCYYVFSFENGEELSSFKDSIADGDIDYTKLLWLKAYKRFYSHDGYLIYGGRSYLLIDFWRENEGVLNANVFNFAANIVSKNALKTSLDYLDINGQKVSAFKSAIDLRQRLLSTDPVDIVYTWVDGSDKTWAARRDSRLKEATGVDIPPIAIDSARFSNCNELLYSLRSVATYMRNVRHIYIVTDNQSPDFIDFDHPGITLVDHLDIFDTISDLPTFNSHSIGSQLHHIEGLSDRYLYFNDDVFIGKTLPMSTFFDETGRALCFYSTSVSMPPSARNDDYSIVDNAAINNRTLLEGIFGQSVYRKFKHVPYAVLRDVMVELEEQFPKQFAATSANPFRSNSDFSIAGALYMHFANIKGRARPSEISYRYYDADIANISKRLKKLVTNLEKERPEILCLNTTRKTEFADRNYEEANTVFESIFPLKSPYEK